MRTILTAMTLLVLVLSVTASVQNTLPAAQASSSIYWAGGFQLPWRTIAVANVDGSGEELLNPYSFGMLIDYDSKIVVDHPGGKIYWPNPHSGTIHRVNVDGNGWEDLGLNCVDSSYFVVDSEGGKIYWPDRETDSIHRASLDGTGEEDLALPLYFNRYFAVDHQGGKIYWPNHGTGTIHRANLDGTQKSDLGLNIFFLSQIVIDNQGAKIYWPAFFTGGPYNDTLPIHRANLDGSGEEEIGLPILYSMKFTLLNEAPPVSEWSGASVVDVEPASPSKGLNYLIALLIPIGAVLLWKGLRKRR